MTNFDSVEKLRERANVSYEDAKTALDACGGDLLEALIYLEKQGKVEAPKAGSYTSKAEVPQQDNNFRQLPPKQPKGDSFSDMMNRFFRWCGKIIHKGNTNYFEVWKGNQKILAVPVTVLLLLLCFAFWVTLPLLVIGLFLSCRYAFNGPEIDKIDVNKVMDSAANAADSIKNEVINTQYNHDNK